jgi:dolichol-phosphate mannosyltransferase
VANALGSAGGYEILVVDDHSQDGTEEACAVLARTYPLRLLVRRNERGLASAVLHGMRQARGTWLVVMDADLSHPPEAVPSLVAPLRAGKADFVLGSRYVPGGSTEEGWGLYRWLNSKIATLLAWPLARVHDPMAGFFALPGRLFEAAEGLDPIGYKIGLELLVKCRCRRVVEVPIHFRNRLHGHSKLSLREQVNYLRHLLRLYRFRLSRPGGKPPRTRQAA